MAMIIPAFILPGIFWGHLFGGPYGRRSLDTVPTLLHFYNSTLTAENMKTINGMIAHPNVEGSEVVFRNGEYSTEGKIMQVR